MAKYTPHDIEAKWRDRWPKERESFKLNEGDVPYYVLDMISYPSSEGLHMGHWRPYTIADVWARYHTLQGKKVLSPVGFDAFGLPAENAAIKNGKHPAVYTKNSILNFTRQIQEMGKMYDWSTLINTSSPEYYKWTQWLFVQLYKNNLAYKKEAPVWWCPKDQTVLANEQVVDGACERCGTEVERKQLRQWFLKITDFAEDLLNFDGLNWPDRVKTLQTNWIGKSTGAEIVFDIADSTERLTVFTTRADTLFGVTYLVLAPEHELVAHITTAEQKAAVTTYITEATKKTDIDRMAEDREKTGVFTGAYAIHPLTHEQVPIWVADYVIGTYGTGAVMAVPAHDERDYAFAKKYSLPISEVIEPLYVQTTDPGKVIDGQPFDYRDAIIAIVKHWNEDKYIGLKWKNVAWGTFITGGIEAGQTPEEAARMEIREETGFLHPKLVQSLGVVHGKFYHVPKQTNRHANARVLYFELEDDQREVVTEAENAIHELQWLTKEELAQFLTPDTHQHALAKLFGKETYTGYGILCNSGAFNGLTSEEAKDKIVAELEKAGKGRATTQYRLRDWLVSRQRYWGAPIPIIYCDTCGEQPVAEADLPVLLPDDVEFLPTGGSPLERHPNFKHATCPKCGGKATRETDTLDTFVDSSWYFLRYTDPTNSEAAFSKSQVEKWLPVDFYVGGTEHSILHLLYARFMMKALHRLGYVPYHEPFQTFLGNGMVYLNGKKMSKSKGNIVNPDDMIKRYGTDAMRGYILFMGPADQDVEWQENGIVGVSRFLYKAWDILTRPTQHASAEINPAIATAYKAINELLPKHNFNRCISTLMIAVNSIEDAELSTRDIEVLTTLMAPFFPHFAEEIWELTGHSESIFASQWPDLGEVRAATATYAIQVNGKLRHTLTTAPDAAELEVVEQAKAEPVVAQALADKTIVKTVFVAGRVVNFVVK